MTAPLPPCPLTWKFIPELFTDDGHFEEAHVVECLPNGDERTVCTLKTGNNAEANGRLIVALSRLAQPVEMLRNVAEHLVKMKDGAHNCAMCGALYHEIRAALDAAAKERGTK